MSNDSLRRRADDLGPTLTGWRRELHRQPELAFEEHRTAEFVETRLRELGLEVRTGIAGTGVAAILPAADRRGPGILLRSDMDALPIQEVPGREYGSQVDGRMHACGHDGHMAMMLGAATILTEQRKRLKRDVVFCFQPAEERCGGGKKMIEDGVLELTEVDAVYALHLWSPVPAGTLHVRPGPMMAAQDEFRARIVGRGGHGAMPQTARDPIVAAAMAVTALQSVVSRWVDPVEAAVVSVGSIHAGSAPNVIPDDARLEGTLRSFTDEVRDLLRTRVREIVERTAAAAGCEAEFELDAGYPATVNDTAAVEAVRTAGAAVFGAENVIEPPPMAPAEDFAYFLRERPGAFVLVGAGNESRGITAPHHSPRFDIDESVLPRGAELLARLALGAGDRP